MSKIKNANSRQYGKPNLGTARLRKLMAFSFFFIILLLTSSYISAGFTFAAYSVSISTVYNGINNGNSVTIMMDGVSTGFKTPHTFSGLLGIHNFTVPYEDASGHPFRRWDTSAPSDQSLSTITVSTAGSFWAFYDIHLPRGNGGATDSVSAAQQRYFVTPSDAAVIAASSGKSWSEIINWVASQIAYNDSCNVWQFPNETLALKSGQCREFSTLAVSMLLAQGYLAYVVSGDVNAASGVEIGTSTGHVWIALQLNGTLFHFEPQKTWANQPTHQNFLGYRPEHFNDNLILFPAVPSSDPPTAETYDVVIHTNYNDVFDTVHVAIMQDGVATGFSTPHTFAGLTGLHNFTLPYLDGEAHPFMCWGTNFPGERIFNTISVTAGGSFSAFYDTSIDLNNLYPAEYMYLITPRDPAVATATSNRNVSSIVDFVAALPYASNTAPQYPNQTLASGTRYYLDYASLCVSMLQARGYNAYIVGGNASGSPGGRWVVFGYDGVNYHINPSYSWAQQQTLNFTSYEPNYYVDEHGIYPPSNSQNPPLKLPNAINSPSPTATFFTPSPTQSSPPTPSVTMTSFPPASSTPKLTDLPSATSTASFPKSPTPLPSVPEMQAWTTLFMMLIATSAFLVFMKTRTKRDSRPK